MVYTVQAEFVKEPLIRTLSDFQSLRRRLRENWPGIAIPVLNARDEEDIDQSIQIESFCEKILSIPNLYNTIEVKTFFSNNVNIKEALNSIQQESLNEIADKYEKLYSDIKDVSFDFPSAQDSTTKFKSQLQKSFNGLVKFKYIIAQSIENYSIDISNKFAFLNYLQVNEKTLINTYSNNDKKFLVLAQSASEIKKIGTHGQNPYLSLLSQLQKEEDEELMFIETLSSLEAIYLKYNDTVKLLDKVEKRMKELRESRLNLFSYFGYKSPEEEKSELREAQQRFGFALKNLRKIIKYSLIEMSKIKEKFKEDKLNAYYNKMKEISITTQKNLGYMEDFFKKVDENSYIKLIKENID